MRLDGQTLFALVPPLLLIEGFFSGSELALLSADKLALKTRAGKGSRRAKLALELVSRPERVLSVTLVMVSLCVMAISSLFSLYFYSLYPDGHSEVYAVAVASPLVVIFGELIPKTLYQRYADRLAPWIAYPVTLAYYALYPMTRVLTAYTSRLSGLLGQREESIAGKSRDTREGLRSLLSYGKRESEIKNSEKRMIKRIFDFKDTEAKHALIPLVRVEAIEEGARVRDALERFQAHRHSRMPVYSGRVDNIVGILEISDLFGATDIDLPLKGHITPAHYVAETQSLEDLLLDMRREDDEMVVVVDEYGGAIGILTFEDIVEEIVGEIQDEYDTETALYKAVTDTSWLAQARIEVQAANEQLGLELPEGDYETLSGFLLQQFGRIPQNGDELFFPTPGGSVKFTVRKATERKIEAVLIEKIRH